MEYISIVALTFMLIVPTAYLFYNYSKDSSEEIVDSQISRIGRNIVDTSAAIFYAGRGSKSVLVFIVPDKIRSAQIIDGRELVFNISTNFGMSEIVFISSVNLTTRSLDCIVNVCNITSLASSGTKKVKLEANLTNSVSINVV